MGMKAISFKSLKICDVGQVEEGLWQVDCEVYLAEGQVEILTFFQSCKRAFQTGRALVGIIAYYVFSLHYKGQRFTSF